MAWEVEGTGAFAGWFAALDEDEKQSVIAAVDLHQPINHGRNMARPWKEIKGTASADTQARAVKRTQSMLEGLPLADLRRARELSQTTLAEALEATQPEVSKIERRTDLYVSTLRRYIEAMGGELEIVARFPDGDVRINQFEELAKA